jgi:hypothetical protein
MEFLELIRRPGIGPAAGTHDAAAREAGVAACGED